MMNTVTNKNELNKTNLYSYLKDLAQMNSQLWVWQHSVVKVKLALLKLWH